MTTVQIELPDEQAAALKAAATAQGLTLEAWFQKIAEQEAPSYQFQRAQAAAARILEIQKHSKPDPKVGRFTTISTMAAPEWLPL